MARTALTAVSAPGGYAGAGAAADGVAGDNVNGNSVAHTGSLLVIAENTSGAELDITFTSTPDEKGRTGDFTEAIAAGVRKIFGPFPTLGWMQSGREFYIDVEAADIELTVVAL